MHAQLCPTLCDPAWTVAHQAPLSMGFSRQEYWSRLPFPSPGDLPAPGIRAASPSPAHPSAYRRAPVWVPWVYSKFQLAICFTHGTVNFYVTLSTHLPFSLLSSHFVHRSVLYVHFSIAALKVNGWFLLMYDRKPQNSPKQLFFN